MPKQKKLTKKELSDYKVVLFKLRDKIVNTLEHRESDALNVSQKEASGDLSGYSFHMADVATDTLETEINLGLAVNTQHLLNEIDAALKRIEEGTYGICEKYDVPISKKRLKVMPYARYSVKAQEEEENNNRPL